MYENTETRRSIKSTIKSLSVSSVFYPKTSDLINSSTQYRSKFKTFRVRSNRLNARIPDRNNLKPDVQTTQRWRNHDFLIPFNVTLEVSKILIQEITLRYTSIC